VQEQIYIAARAEK